jgi:hypothetical protein
MSDERARRLDFQLSRREVILGIGKTPEECRRIAERLATSSDRLLATRIPRRVLTGSYTAFLARFLQQALALRDRHHRGEVSSHGLAVARGHLMTRLGQRLDRPSRVTDVRRFTRHLHREFPAIWSFLFDPTIDATNWRAEQAIRPAVVTRKVWGGNRSWRGAHAQQTLTSVIRTAQQRQLNPHTVLVSMLRARQPTVPRALQTAAVN